MWRRTKRVLIASGVGLSGYYGYKTYKDFNDRIIANWSSQYANAIIPSRAEHKQRAKQEDFDVLVIGGGATGSGIALDAATRGLKVALVEREDFASGTSSRSTKLLHGGIRYLEKAAKHLDYGEFKLVTEALHERTRILHNAPHLSRALPLVLPIRSWIELPQYWIGLKMYDTIAGASGMFKSYYLSKEQTVQVFPTINSDIFKCSVVYYDGQMNDARLNVSIALTAAAHGATLVNHTEVLKLVKKPNPYKGSATSSNASASPFSSSSSETSNVHLATTSGTPVLLPTEAAPKSETPTDEGVSSPAEPAAFQSSQQPITPPPVPSYAQPPLPPPTPSPPPAIGAPENPIEKAIETIKSYITGSSKNVETGVSYLKADNIVSGAVVRDNILIISNKYAGEEYEIKAKCVINATGPFADVIRQLDDAAARPLVAASAGSHIILPNYYCPPDIGFVDAKSPDGRVIFLLPFENHTLVGTTDYPCDLATTPKPPESDITFILEQVRTYLSPEIKVKRSDVLAAWTGIRPLALDHSSPNTAQISRNHVIHVDESGLVTIVGGKWTTYRRMAEETVEKAVEAINLNPPHKSHTEKLPLWGAHKYKPTLHITLMQTYGLDQDIAQHLSHNYGDKAFIIAELARKGYGRRLVEELPFLEAEIVYSVNEYAETAVDVIARRTRLAFLDNEKTKAAIPKVIDLLAVQLQWDEARKQKETISAYAFLETMK